jgi:hypothetical protein
MNKGQYGNSCHTVLFFVVLIMFALKVILSKILCALLYVLGACVALYRLHFELFYLTPYLASANTLFCSIGRTQSNVAVLSISSYFPAALGIPMLDKLQRIPRQESRSKLSNDK